MQIHTLLFVLLICMQQIHIHDCKVRLNFRSLKEIFPFSIVNDDSPDLSKLLKFGVQYESKEELPNYHKLESLLESREEGGPKITIPFLGTIQGKVIKTIFGKEFYAFHSIPYAQPPTGEFRFQMPRPWVGELPTEGRSDFYDGSYIRTKCPQISMFTDAPGGREDCLHLHVYTPKNFESETSSLPVMFFIHGGAYQNGDSSTYVPTKLLDKDVVVVVVQYRLGSLGFLASQTPDNPGNMALMDQITALRWVHKYIHNFGGNNQSVTVFGQSAGSACTSWLQFTNLTKESHNDGNKILHRVITQSGTALDAWAIDSDPAGAFVAQAEELSCWDGSSSYPFYYALQCLREKTTAEIVKAFDSVYLKDRLNGGLGTKGSAPILQKKLAQDFSDEIAENPDLLVLAEAPFDMLESDRFLHVPVMAGAVRDEGSVFLGYIFEEYLMPNNLTNNETFLSLFFLPHVVKDLEIRDVFGTVANSLKLSFLRYAKMGDFSSMSGGLVDMIGMVLMKSGGWQMAHYQTYKNAQNPFYFYSFEIDSDDSLFDWFFMGMEFDIEGGIAHGDELIYLFNMPSLLNEDQLKHISRLTTMWVNFAKYGNPTPPEVDSSDDEWRGLVPEWKEFSLRGLEYLLMSERFSLEKDFKTRWNFNTLRNLENPGLINHYS